MKTRPFLIATLVSTLLQSLYYAIMTGIMLLIFPNMMETFLQDIPSNGGPPPGIFNFMGLSLLMGCVSWGLALVAYTGTGALYTWLHRREETPVSAEQGAIGGAAAAFTARLVTGIFVAIASLLVSNLFLGTMTDVLNAAPGVGTPPGFPPMFSVFNSLTSVFGSLFSACLGSIFAGMLGALGGAISGAVLK